MSKSTRYIIIAVILLIALAVGSTYLSGSGENLSGRFSFSGLNQGAENNLEATVLTEERAAPTEGSNEEVYRFALKAPADLSLDYLSFEIEYEGLLEEALETPEYWQLREVTKGSVGEQVGEGVLIEEGILRLQMDKYSLKAGEEKIFILTTHVYDNNVENHNSLTISIPAPSRVSKTTDWLWTMGNQSYGLRDLN